ncbi:MAG: ATP-binding protein [Sporomusaceae bacterium]|nr:ATP-binding protein [Sporomusaceae bacterium]
MKSFDQLVRHDGNHDLFLAVKMSVAALAGGHPFHLHSEGLRGTGKTTVLRSAVSILPPIIRIKGCLYNCDPARPHCPEHSGLSAEQIKAVGSEWIPCPFLEISHGAKISTVVGSIDLGRLTDPARPVAALLPGTIPQAHRGVIFVDEINRLADTSPELADVLLDVMGTKPGRIQIEEAGMPVVHMPAQVTVWAASNPDEEPGALAQIRKQLSDRFDMTIGMGRPSDVQAVLNILRGDAGVGAGASEQWRQAPFGDILVDDAVRQLLASVYVNYGLESLRAIEAMETAARLNAMLSGRSQASVQDILHIVPLVLSHRADPATVSAILKFVAAYGSPDAPAIRSVAAGSAASAPLRSPEQRVEGAKKRLNDWWERVKAKLARGDNRERPSSAANERQHSARGKIADPTEIDIVAPPKPAAPLAQLSPDNYVTSDEKGADKR